MSITIKNESLGTSFDLVATGNAYDDAKRIIDAMAECGQKPGVDQETINNIEYVAGPLSEEAHRLLGF